MNEQAIFDGLVKRRKIKNIDNFINPRYQDIHDPTYLPDIDKALKRLEKAKKNKELVAVYGDYDIDGLSAVALLEDAFASFDIKTTSFIPDRFVDGYGLVRRGVDEIAKKGATLIITVDCGSNSEKEIAYASKRGVDVIVTDHHEITDVPKSAIAVINAKRKDNKYPFRERSGAGIAFALIQAMRRYGFEGLDEGQEKWLLDLVALSTISDVVDLVDENRVLAHFGIKVLRQTKRPGLRAIIKSAGVDINSADEETIGYRIGPRLNASGRLEHAMLSLNVLQCKEEDEARVLAEKLERMNTKRKTDQDKIYKEALKKAYNSEDSVLVLSDKNWSHGINGIVAAKISEKLLRPTFIMQELEDGTTKGSARSVGEYNLAKALAFTGEILIKGGGHHFAAGATIKTANLEKFRTKLNQYFRNQKLELHNKSLLPEFDLRLTNLEGLNLKLAKLIEKLKPFGQANPEPKFLIEGVLLKSFRAVGADGVHAQLSLEDDLGNMINGISFYGSESSRDLLNKKVDVVGALKAEQFNGNQYLKLHIVHISTSKGL